MESVPYYEKSDDGHFIRTFDSKTQSEELKWHFDDENRIIIPLSGTNWQIQIDESLPVHLEIGKEYFIPVDVYHRILKGNDDLVIKLYKLNSIKSDQPKYVRKYTDNLIFSDYLSYHLQNNISLNNNIFRYASDAWCDLIQEVKELYEKDQIDLSEEEIELINDDAGKIIYIENEKFILNTPFLNTDNNMDKKYFVYICDENKKIEKIYFNDEE